MTTPASTDQHSNTIQHSPRRRFLAIGAVCLGVFALGSAWQAAIATPAASRAVGPTSVAIINLNRVAEGLEEMKEKQAKLAQDAESYRVRMQDLAKRIEEIDQDLTMMGELTPDASDATIRARREKIQQKLELEVLGKARQESLQRMLDLEVGTLLRDAYLKIEIAAKKIGEADGWDLILIDDRDGLPKNLTRQEFRQLTEGRQVLHVSPTIDITDQLITMMNNEYKANIK